MTKRNKPLKRREEDEVAENVYRKKTEELFTANDMFNEFFAREIKELDEKKVHVRITLEKLR